MNEARRVIIDQRSLSQAGSDRGLGRYAAAVLDGARSSPSVQSVDLQPASAPRKMRHLVLREADPSRTAVLHTTSPLHLPLVKDRPWICSIQDVIPLDVRAYQKLGVKTRALFLNARRADLVVVNSYYTATRVEAQLGIPGDRMRILPLPVPDVFFEAATAPSGIVPSSVVVMVDHRTFDPRKRFHWVNRFADIASQNGLRVIVVGRADTEQLARGVEYVESPTDAELARLYSEALATFYPSSYEGQGLPPLEAMAAGCPVIAFSNSSVGEMVAVPDFLLEDPHPWTLQRFDQPMPAATLTAVDEKLRGWSADVSAFSRVRSLARSRAEVFRRQAFVEALGVIYGEQL